MAEESKVVVSLRVKDLATVKGEEILQFDTTEESITIEDGKDFSFDHVFDGDTKQEDVYSIVGQPVVDNVIQGFNACVFTYGQSGSGKTYTMIGEEGHEGLIPRISRDLLSQISIDPSACTFTVTYVEVYMEKLKDLLTVANENISGGAVSVREHPQLGIMIDGATKVVVTTHEEIMELIEHGNRNRKVTGTAMNADSSRSHAIFTIVLEQKAQNTKSTTEEACKKQGRKSTTEKACKKQDRISITTGACKKQGRKSKVNEMLKVSRLNLIDLAGSESAKTANTQGQSLREGSAINKSLSTLGRVIKAVAAKNAKSEMRIPYRDSVLTFLLKDSLGGNAKTNMIATIRPEARCEEQTLSTLRYAQIANMVVNKAVINEHPLQKKVNELEAVICTLMTDLDEQEKDQLKRAIKTDDVETLKHIAEAHVPGESPSSCQLKDPPSSNPEFDPRAESERGHLREELAHIKKELENEKAKHAEEELALAITKQELELERVVINEERHENMRLREELRIHEEKEQQLLQQQKESIEVMDLLLQQQQAIEDGELIVDDTSTDVTIPAETGVTFTPKSTTKILQMKML